MENNFVFIEKLSNEKAFQQLFVEVSTAGGKFVFEKRKALGEENFPLVSF